MPHGLHIDGARGYVVVRYWGRVDFAELDQVRKEIEASPSFRPGLDRLWDERGCEIVVTTDELDELSRRWAANDHLHGKRRLAYLVDHDLTWGFNRQFESFRDPDSTDVESRLFRGYAEARDWLGLPGDLPEPRLLIPTPDPD